MGLISTPWTWQPQTNVDIDLANPLTRNLVSLINVAAPKPSLTRVGAPDSVLAPRKLGMAHLANNGSMWTEGNKGALGSAATIFIVGNFYGGGVSSVPAAIGVSGAYDCLFAFQNMVSGGGNLRALIRVANAGGISSVEGPVTEYTDDAVFFATYDGTSSLSLFRNGVDISSARANTAASGAMANEMNNFSLGGVNRGTDAYGQPGQRTYLAGFWNRVLRSDERLELSRNPWQLFAPLSRQIWVGPSAASSLPTLSASTYKPGTLTTTGWQPRVTAS